MLCFDIWGNAAFKHGVRADQCYAPIQDEGFANATLDWKRAVKDHKYRMKQLPVPEAPVLILCDPSPNPSLDHNLDRGIRSKADGGACS